MSPIKLILSGFILVLGGVVLPWLMMIRLIEPNFALCFLSYASSLGGVILGIIGAALYVRSKRGGWD
ncbi:TPA: hypothetical protein EYP12_08435 [Candidatus Bipolaricaulota bacterium]|nr:hypothetical protein [Candidatus Bipolaricaulota bacterium]